MSAEDVIILRANPVRDSLPEVGGLGAGLAAEVDRRRDDARALSHVDPVVAVEFPKLGKLADGGKWKSLPLWPVVDQKPVDGLDHQRRIIGVGCQLVDDVREFFAGVGQRYLAGHLGQEGNAVLGEVFADESRAADRCMSGALS